MSGLRVSRDSSGGGETLASRALPQLGGEPRRKSPWHLFWRNVALVLLAHAVMRLIADLLPG